MKRKNIICFLLVLTLVLVAGCGKKENSGSKEVNNDIKLSNKSIVLYFSITGNTEKIAKRIANKSNSDIIKIIPKVRYTKEDIDYNNDCRANREQNDSKARPEIENTIDINKYDIIYLGYPIWWGTNPKIILTLLDTYDFSNKIIIPFCTSGSSGIGSSVSDLRNYNPSLNIKNGRRFSLSDSDDDILEFINNSLN